MIQQGLQGVGLRPLAANDAAAVRRESGAGGMKGVPEDKPDER